MRIAANFVSALLRRSGRLFGGLAAAVLLLPLPAMALTFTSAWQAVTLQSGGPTPPKPTFTDSTTGGADSLTVNMGSYQGQTKTAVEAIALARSITVPTAGEAIQFAEQFATQFKQGGVDLAVAVFDNHGNLVAAPITFNQQTNSKAFTTITGNQSVKQTINGGNYILTVGVAYNTNNKIGGWKAISAHHFQITGL